MIMTTDARIEELEAQLEVARRRAEEAESRGIRTEQRLGQLAVETSIRDAAARSATPINPAALSDVLRRASQTGQWQEVAGHGLVLLDNHMPAVSSDGRYVSPKVWLESLQAE